MAKIIRNPKLNPAKTIEHANGGYEGAAKTSRELATWQPSLRSPDLDLNHDKPMIDARSRDMVRNDGYALGAVASHRDSIVGGQYVLNAQPDFEAMGADEAWAEEFQRVVESKFSLWAESQDNWPDAARRNNFTGLVRLAVAGSVLTGEVLGTAEWLRSEAERRPYSTAIQMIDPDRLSNPRNQSDTATLRRGIKRDKYGAALSYFFRSRHPSENYMDGDQWTWKEVKARKPWGRLQVIHIFEALRPDQSRGVADMAAALKQMKMTSKFSDVVLQNAVLNATYAATIESELPNEVIWEQMGAGDGSAITTFLNQLAEYGGGSKALHLDGIKIPHLFPGTKLNFTRATAPEGVGDAFEQSLLRKIAASLGLSYEEFSRDYSQSNYSSARASMLHTWKSMQAKKKMIADRFATNVYSLWLEEAINKGEIPLPKGAGPAFFYEGLNKEALTRCEWIGAARGQIDEAKETQAALDRIAGGLSTYEDEIGRTGKDFRRVFRQRAREEKMKKELDLTFTADVEATAATAAASADTDAEPGDNDVAPKKSSKESKSKGKKK
jgi:lambda family phage portal protein